MLELLYSAHLACGGLFMTRFPYCQAVPGGRVSCVLVTMSFEVVVPVGGVPLMYSEVLCLCDGELDVFYPAEMMNHFVCVVFDFTRWTIAGDFYV